MSTVEHTGTFACAGARGWLGPGRIRRAGTSHHHLPYGTGPPDRFPAPS